MRIEQMAFIGKLNKLCCRFLRAAGLCDTNERLREVMKPLGKERLGGVRKKERKRARLSLEWLRLQG